MTRLCIFLVVLLFLASCVKEESLPIRLPDGLTLRGAWFSYPDSGMLFCLARPVDEPIWRTLYCRNHACYLWEDNQDSYRKCPICPVFQPKAYFYQELLPVRFVGNPIRLDFRLKPLTLKQGLSVMNQNGELFTLDGSDWERNYSLLDKAYFKDLEKEKSSRLETLRYYSEGQYLYFGAYFQQLYTPFFLRKDPITGLPNLAEDGGTQAQYSRTVYLSKNRIWALNTSARSALGQDLRFYVDTIELWDLDYGHCRTLKVGTRPDWVLYTRACEPAKRGEQVLVPKQLFQLGSGQILVLAQAKADLAQHYLYELDHEQDSLIELHRFRSEAQSWVVGYYPDSTGALFSSPETSECLFYDARQGARSWLPPK